MGKEGIITASIILFIIAILIIWPKIEIQPSFDKNTEINDSLKIGAWNRGGLIGGFYIISADACISATIFNKEVKCTHQGYIGEVDCSMKVCDEAKPGRISREEVFNLNFINNSFPENFDIEVKVIGQVSIFPVWKDTKKYTCTKNVSYYFCEDQAP